ncbi:MAG: hypothetical protein KDA41_09060 [Planctomycetales bacterium]|nr:hypothetical protein [Planctomycetales bacterium]
MPENLLDRLTSTEVPPPPRDFRRAVHGKVNQWLLAGQLAELLGQAFVFAVAHLAPAVISLIFFTLTGRHVTHRRPADTHEQKE